MKPLRFHSHVQSSPLHTCSQTRKRNLFFEIQENTRLFYLYLASKWDENVMNFLLRGISLFEAPVFKNIEFSRQEIYPLD